MWFMWFVLFSPAWWILVSIELLFMGWCVEEEWPGRAFISLAIFAAILLFFGNFNVLAWGWANPGNLFRYGMMYVGAGIVWGLLKYYLFLAGIKREYQESKERYMMNHDLEAPMLALDLKKWRSNWTHTTRHRFEEDTKFFSKSDRIITWMAYWPMSFFWTLLSDILKNFFTWILDGIKFLFQGVRKVVLRELFADEKAARTYQEPPKEAID